MSLLISSDHEGETAPSIRLYCPLCSQQLRWMQLWEERRVAVPLEDHPSSGTELHWIGQNWREEITEHLTWFAGCHNYSCPQGPRLIKSLDPSTEGPQK